MKNLILITFSLLAINSITFGQKGVIKGQLIDYKTSKPIAGKTIILFGTTSGVTSDKEGRFEFDNLKLKNTELIIYGGHIHDSGIGNKKNYYTLSLRNIKLNENNRTIDLKIIYLLDSDQNVSNLNFPCIILDEKTFQYKFVGGADRHFEGKFGLIDFSTPSKNCAL
ncbi:peptidase associated/transthyretin-like domain-containing protein [Marinigracilibium pacificum]|uniref:Carboxypeptidase-like regulatory domain-containing protein n=1 Tax=Marinigracilibium pacificum TaxID=2729599 RepID=A0A848J5M8_9BACT|nr:carboxypeptidase-like regulatory domain-containing protein [Marinigracilibium pacificum]NMM50775.1 carboxypeptidase-like regulatory domain-containing protein [Marinigracilibium pacificum]